MAVGGHRHILDPLPHEKHPPYPLSRKQSESQSQTGLAYRIENLLPHRVTLKHTG